MKSLFLLVITILLAVCSGCTSPSKRAMYKLAQEAVKTDPYLPLNAVLYPMGKAKFYVGKNSACVHLGYDFVNEARETVAGFYMVWLKNMAHSWQVDRCSRLTPHSSFDEF